MKKNLAKATALLLTAGMLGALVSPQQLLM